MSHQTVLKANLDQHSWSDVEKGNHIGFWKHEWQAHGQCLDTVFPVSTYQIFPMVSRYVEEKRDRRDP
ncbi:putative ribonuclease T2 [Rosa chinensis]|uniref:Putative ribonuclease T2 n=1 Tax=Rosa chinensis TaxID=74649 RepID=A0A2P6PUY4_ROSCH|nr:putative ribonuclease T2 [Rosa chinensis]